MNPTVHVSYDCICHIWLVAWNMTFLFPFSWDDDPIWLIFFNGVETTNQWTSNLKTVYDWVTHISRWYLKCGHKIYLSGWWLGTWLFFFHSVGMMIQSDSYFSRGLKPPISEPLIWRRFTIGLPTLADFFLGGQAICACSTSSSSKPRLSRCIQYITLWWTNIAMEHDHRNSGFSH